MRSLAILSLALAAPVLSQANTAVTLTVGNMVYSQQPLLTTNAYVDASMMGQGAASPDHLFSNWWYYRVAGDTQETSFRLDAAPNAPTRVVSAPTIVTTWPNVAGRGLFSAVLTNILVSTSATTGYLVNQMSITNTTNAPLAIDMFSYVDIDTNGSNVANDCFGDGRSQYVERQASLTYQGEFYCPDADTSMVTAWLTTTPGMLPFILTNTTLDNLTAFPGTLLNADCAGAFQWTRTIPANGTMNFTSYVAVMSARPLQSLYGTAGPGTPGLPVIGASARAIVAPAVGLRSFQVTLSNARATSLAVLISNFTQAALPLAGLQIWVDPNGAATFLGVTSATGTHFQTFNVPPLAGLVGLNLKHQFLVSDPGGVAGFASYTQGLAQTLGGW